jgi:hypothetical protein
VLVALVLDDGRSATEIDSLLQVVHRNLDPQLIAELVRKNLVRLQKETLFLTDVGRSTALEVLAISKIVEEDALGQVDHAEAALVKGVLRQVIRTCLAGNPALTAGPR